MCGLIPTSPTKQGKRGSNAPTTDVSARDFTEGTTIFHTVAPIDAAPFSFPPVPDGTLTTDDREDRQHSRTWKSCAVPVIERPNRMGGHWPTKNAALFCLA